MTAMLQFEAMVAEAFRRFDKDGRGLDRHLLKCAYAACMGRKPCRLQMDLLMARAGRDDSRHSHGLQHDEEQGSGLLPWEQFRDGMLALMERTEDPAHHVQQVYQTFTHPPGLGFITRSAAHLSFRTALPHVSVAVVDEVFDEVDVDQDGRVGIRDFMGMMMTATHSSQH